MNIKREIKNVFKVFCIESEYNVMDAKGNILHTYKTKYPVRGLFVDKQVKRYEQEYNPSKLQLKEYYHLDFQYLKRHHEDSIKMIKNERKKIFESSLVHYMIMPLVKEALVNSPK